MAITHIYQWKKYNSTTDTYDCSKRMATRDAIKAFGNCVPIENTEMQIDESKLDGNGTWIPTGTTE